MLAEKFIRANEEEEKEIVSDLTSLERDKNVTELKNLKQNLEQKYSKLEKSLNEKFKSLSELLEERRCFLMNELNNYHKECQSLIDSYLINFNEQENNESINDLVFTITNAINLLDKWTNEENNLINDDKKLISFFENLNSLVKNSSKLIVENKSKDNLCVNKSDDCSIRGNGLSECFTNEEASFVLEFKNRAASYLSKSSVSFLGNIIFFTKWKLIMK
jgi:hypothetical protein